MKKTKTIFIIALFAIMTFACKSTADEVIGTYHGTLTYGETDSTTTIDTTATCVITKIDDNQVSLTCTSASVSGGINISDITIKGANSPYTLHESGISLNGFSGTCDNNTLTWTYSPFSFWHAYTYNFTGTK